MRVANGERYPAFPTRQNPQRETGDEAWRLFIVGLALVLITLKLSGHITWSWPWVIFWMTSPVWLPAAGICVVYAIAFAVVGVMMLYKKLRKK